MTERGGICHYYIYHTAIDKIIKAIILICLFLIKDKWVNVKLSGSKAVYLCRNLNNILTITFNHP